MAMQYNEKVMEHFRHPRNMGVIENPDAVGFVGNKTCGDAMKIFLRVEKRNGKNIIKDIKFQTYGCVSAIATTSITTEMVKGKTLDEAYNIGRADAARELGGLPPIKMHCSNLASEAIQAAIDDYRKKHKNIKENV
ncbi:MAG: iron-sulfur cluster assembly scaffold protein [Candidatus Aenigmarchaeota archaeon]|nr:iron-sulfur cluster assembly scaffold protein [Candidatus Aenigmarchaeota archaeon]